MSEKSPKKRQYRVPCTWETYGLLYVEAESAEQAKIIADEEPLPSGDYVDGSWEIDEEMFEYFLEEDGNLEPPYDGGFGIHDEEEIK